MSSSSLPPVQQACSTAQPVKRPLSVKYTEETLPTKLSEAEEYFGLCIAKVFLVNEGVYSPKGSAGLAKGDIFVVCLKKPVSFLKLRSAVPSPGNDSVTVPWSVVTRTEFALTPLSQEDDERDAAIKSWERVYQSVAEFLVFRKSKSLPMPAALKVLSNAVDHNKQKVPANTILFNICMVSLRVGVRKRHGLEGVDYSDTIHCFLESEDPLYFSTRLYDVKCLPMHFKSVLQLPQTARVYLDPNMEEEENSLQNLSTVTIIGVIDGHDLVMRKLSDGGDELGPTFTIPWNADLKVVAIKLKDSRLLDEISNQRCIKVKPCPNPTPSDDMVTAVKMEFSELEESATVKRRISERRLPALPPPPLSDNQHSLTLVSTPGEELYEEIQDTRLTSSDTTPLAPNNEKSDRGGQESRSPLVRCKTVPLPQTPSPSPRRRNTIGNESDLQKSILDACPTEPDLRFHVAAKLGRDWRSAGTYLGLQHWQLDQADWADSKLEEKAMETLVMWLRGQGDSKEPRSWKAVLRALHRAGRNDMTSELERDIKDGRLRQSEQHSPTR